MLDGLAADGHGVGHAIEPGLDLVEDAFVLARFRRWCSSGVERGLSAQDEQAVRFDSDRYCPSVRTHLSFGQVLASGEV